MMNVAYPIVAPDNSAPLMAMQGDFEENLIALRDIGYHNIELLVRDADDLENTNYDVLLKKYDMHVAALSTAPMEKQDHLTLLSSQAGEEAYQRAVRILDIAKKYHCPVLVGKFRGNVGEKDKAALAESLKRLCVEARNRQVMILVEPQSKSNINNINNLEEAVDLILNVGMPNLGIHLDTFHMDIEEEDQVSAVKQYAKYIGFVHIADTERKVPGEGKIPLRAIIGALNEDVVYSPEIKQNPSSRECAQQFFSWAASEEE